MYLIVCRQCRRSLPEYRARWRHHAWMLPLLLSVAGCAERLPPQVWPANARTYPPHWVSRGSGTFDRPPDVFEGPRSPTFYGVGSSWGIRKPTVARATAEDRARAHLARFVERFWSDLVAGYVRSLGPAPEGQRAEPKIATFTSRVVEAAEIVEHFVSPDDHSQYALAALPLTELTTRLGGMSDLEAAMRQYAQAHAGEVFASVQQAHESVPGESSPMFPGMEEPLYQWYALELAQPLSDCRGRTLPPGTRIELRRATRGGTAEGAFGGRRLVGIAFNRYFDLRSTDFDDRDRDDGTHLRLDGNLNSGWLDLELIGPQGCRERARVEPWRKSYRKWEPVPPFTLP